MRKGNHGKTANFWISYMDHIWVILCLIHAVKVNCYQRYAQTLLLMPDLFFSYGVWIPQGTWPFFGFFLANIEHSHLGATALLKNGASSFALSLIPGNSCGVDKTIEKTFMRLAKSRDGSGAGLVGLTQNYGAYQRWVRTTHERVNYWRLLQIWTICIHNLLHATLDTALWGHLQVVSRVGYRFSAVSKVAFIAHSSLQGFNCVARNYLAQSLPSFC